jgi:heat shock protein HspQ
MYYLILTGNTELEARQKAEKTLKDMQKNEPMRQPHMGAVYQHLSGEWRATIQYWGLD